MSSSRPPIPGLRLPKDPDALARMRDQLEESLRILEDNTQNISAWLEANRRGIALSYRRLGRAVTEGNEAAALRALDGEVAGFVLQIRDFDAEIIQAFGADSMAARRAATKHRGLPAALQEKLPDLSNWNVADQDVADPAADALEMERLKENAPGWYSLSALFSGEGKKLESELGQRRENLRKWLDARARMIGTASDQHYYIDSFMDWVGAGMGPDKTVPADADRLKYGYQNPAYVLNAAWRDYVEAVEDKAGAVARLAENYATLAGFLDAKKYDAFATALPDAFFPVPPTPESALLRDMLLEDTGTENLCDLALTCVTDMRARQKIFTIAAAHEKQVDARIFSRVLDQVLWQMDPLDPAALETALHHLPYQGEKDGPAVSAVVETNAFARTVERFSGAPADLRAVLLCLLRGMNLPGANPAEDPFMETAVTAFAAFAAEKNPGMALYHLAAAPANSGKAAAQAFKALWQMSNPGKDSLAAALAATAGGAEDLGGALSGALNLGLIDDEARDPGFVAAILSGAALPDPEEFPLDAGRRLIAAGFGEHKEELRRHAAEVWLPSLAAGGIPAGAKLQYISAAKLQWIAALLEPFDSDIARANLLHDAASKAPQAQDALDALARSLVGDNLPLPGDAGVLFNINRISNIWYTPETQTLYYATQGASFSMASAVGPAAAAEFLTLVIRRNEKFLPEADGCFQPARIERVSADAGGVHLVWNDRRSPLNAGTVAMQALGARKDFLHGAGPQGAMEDLNTAAIALVRPAAGGTGTVDVMDKYGATLALLPHAPSKHPAGGGLADLSGGVFFNPAHASVVIIDRENPGFSFRIESAAFDAGADDSGFLRVALPDASALDTLESAVAAAPGTLRAGKNTWINLPALGYAAYDDDPAQRGLHCRRIGERTPGIIGIDDPAVADGILDAARKSPDIVVAGNTMVHADSVGNAYAGGGQLVLVCGMDILRLPCAPEESREILERLAARPGFSATHDADGAPSDVVRTGEATMAAVNRAAGSGLVLTLDGGRIPVMDEDASPGDDMRFIEKVLQEGRGAPDLKRLLSRPKVSVPERTPPDDTAPLPRLAQRLRETFAGAKKKEKKENKAAPPSGGKAPGRRR